MAMIDYGVIIKKNGEFINKDKGLFMECPNFVHSEYKDNYFCYLGDEDCYVMTYKNCLKVITNGETEWLCYNNPFISQTRYCKNFNITVSRLEPNYIEEYYADYGKSWEEFVDDHYYYEEYKGERSYDPSDLDDGYNFKKLFMWWKKKMAITKGVCYKYTTNRSVATWEYKGDKYEVIFGYGIEPNTSVWNDIKYRYGFTDNERNIIDRWFE